MMKFQKIEKISRLHEPNYICTDEVYHGGLKIEAGWWCVPNCNSWSYGLIDPNDQLRCMYKTYLGKKNIKLTNYRVAKKLILQIDKEQAIFHFNNRDLQHTLEFDININNILLFVKSNRKNNADVMDVIRNFDNHSFLELNEHCKFREYDYIRLFDGQEHYDYIINKISANVSKIKVEFNNLINIL